jgi:hypothetical protein
MIALGNGVKHGALSRMAVAASIRGGGLALRLPVLRAYFLEKMVRRPEASYDECEDDREALLHARWFGQHLGAFLHRLIEERPAAASTPAYETSSSAILFSWLSAGNRRRSPIAPGRAS